MTYLNKEKLTEELNKTPMIAQHIDCMDLFDAINNSIAENVTDVVRCKDCKYRFVDGDNVRFNMCLLNHNKVQPDDWFCADGERKSDK